MVLLLLVVVVLLLQVGAILSRRLITGLILHADWVQWVLVLGLNRARVLSLPFAGAELRSLPASDFAVHGWRASNVSMLMDVQVLAAVHEVWRVVDGVVGVVVDVGRVCVSNAHRNHSGRLVIWARLVILA